MVMKTALLVLLMLFDLLTCSSGTFSLLVPDPFISARIGSSLVLPCGVSTTLDIRSYEVRWHRPNKPNNPVLLYKDLMVQENTGDPQYRGRVSLIGDLKEGNASLKLVNLTLADRGEYVCHVKSTEWYEKASMSLNITVVGSPPVLSLVEDGEQIKVTCTSSGWSPKPTLTWKDKGGIELEDSTDYHKTDSEGLVSVSSWLLFPPSESEWISCSVGLPDQELKEGRVLPFKPAPTALEPGVSPGWKAFTTLLVISLLASSLMLLFLVPKIRDHNGLEDTNLSTVTEEKEHLVEESNPPTSLDPAQKETETSKATVEKIDKGTDTEKEIPDWDMMPSCKVAVKPDASSTSFLEVGNKRDRVTCKADIQDKTRFVHVLCEERISSGRYYWEIKSLIEPYTEKGIITSTTYKCPTSWYVGVTSESPEKKKKVPLTPQNDFWVLQYEKDKGYYVYDFSQTPVLVRDRFSKLGVFIDCEKHILSFYDCDKQRHLYTFNNVYSTSPLIPVLSPGDKKGHTIIMCHENVTCEIPPLHEQSA